MQQGGILGMVLPIGLFVVIFYFLIIRPQKKKQKAHETMLASVGRGDTIVTAGGFFGIVRDILEDSYILDVGDGVKMRILRSSISHKRNPEDGTSLPKKGKNEKHEKTEEKAEQKEHTEKAPTEAV